MLTAEPGRALPLHVTSNVGGHRNGNRSALTCRYKCGDACFHDVPNTSDNPTFGELRDAALSRRTMLRVGAVVGAGAAGAAAFGLPAAAAGGSDRGGKHRPSKPRPARGLAFDAVAPNTADTVTVPKGYRSQVVISWGDPVLRGAPAFDPARQSARAQQGQFGYNNDFLGVLPLTRGTKLLTVNHEYTDEVLMFAGYDAANPTREQVEIAQAAHGLSVVAVREEFDRDLEPITGHRLNRRFHTHSEFELTGPVAGHPLVRTTADPRGRTVLGTLNNCSGGLTPWRTWLTAEENFNQYFANADSVTDATTAARLARYGIKGAASERKWERFEDRFDLAKEPNEVNRFGWVVEIDPYDPQSVPRKRTALGRFKHEAAQPRVGRDGRVAVYMGDDERFDYFYKFVTDDRIAKGSSDRARRHNATLLDHGTLYVASFTGDSPADQIDGNGALPADGEFDGSGRWIRLVHSDGAKATSYVPGFTGAEVLLFTRQAADVVGATKMDRPEDVEPNPRTGVVYIACTNNTDRGKAGKAAADEANPRNANKHGHVIEVTERRNDPSATSFDWGIFLVCGDPEDPATYFGGYDKSQVSPISCPDNVAFDRFGNLWISTDGNALGTHDGLFAVATAGPERGHLKQFLTMPTGAETCGPHVDSDRVMVCVQHPGETDGSTATAPSSQWPDGPGRLPRPSVVSVTPRSRWREVGEA